MFENVFFSFPGWFLFTFEERWGRASCRQFTVLDTFSETELLKRVWLASLLPEMRSPNGRLVGVPLKKRFGDGRRPPFARSVVPTGGGAAVNAGILFFHPCLLLWRPFLHQTPPRGAGLRVPSLLRQCTTAGIAYGVSTQCGISSTSLVEGSAYRRLYVTLQR